MTDSASLVVALPWICAAAVLLSAAVLRPRRSRVPAPAATSGRSLGASARMGASLRRLTGRPPDPAAEQRLGRTLLSVVAGGVVDVRLGFAAGVAMFVVPIVQERKRAQRRRAHIIRELPEVIDLLRLSLAGGGSLQLAVQGVAATELGPVTRALRLACLRVERGHRLTTSLELLVAQTGDEVRPLVRALVGAEHYGTELLPTLERLGAEARDHRRRSAQTAARRVPIRLLMPLVMCILPAFVLLTLVPTLAGTLAGLDL